MAVLLLFLFLARALAIMDEGGSKVRWMSRNGRGQEGQGHGDVGRGVLEAEIEGGGVDGSCVRVGGADRRTWVEYGAECAKGMGVQIRKGFLLGGGREAMVVVGIGVVHVLL